MITSIDAKNALIPSSLCLAASIGRYIRRSREHLGRHSSSFLSVGALVFFVGASQVHADVLEFGGGVGTSSFDQYTGTAGGGWSGAWTEVGSFTTSVVNTSPVVSGGGNYLSVTDVDAAEGIYRQFQATATESYTFETDFRIDALPTAGTATVNFAIGRTDQISTGGDNFVQLTAKAGESFEWVFSGNDGSGGTAQSGSGINIVAGATYHLSFEMNPVAKSYVATIGDGVNSYTSGSILFRYQGAITASPYVKVGMQGGAGDDLGFSLDNVGVIPEPSQAAMFLGVFALMGVVVRRRGR